jgi:hypothetical protein
MNALNFFNEQSGPNARKLASLALSGTRVLLNHERATVAGSALTQAELEIKRAFPSLLSPSRETSKRIASLASRELRNPGSLSWSEFQQIAGSVVSQSPYKSAFN